MKNIIILGECAMTRIGLTALLLKEHRVFCPLDLSSCEALLDGPREIDLIIVFSPLNGVTGMIQLSRLLRRYQPLCKVLLESGSVSLPLMRFYSHCLHLCVGLIDLWLPVSVLVQSITQVICEQRTLSIYHIIGNAQLNERERSVLQALIMGLVGTEIASRLALSVKTVSGYKRSGLGKLGARNLQAMILPTASRRGYR